MKTNELGKLAIQDLHDGSATGTNPSDRQILERITALWRNDPSAESLDMHRLLALMRRTQADWIISDQRMKDLIESSGILPNVRSEQPTYASRITSLTTPNLELPPGIETHDEDTMGKGLVSSHRFQSGDLLWKESPLFLIPPLTHYELIRIGKACTFCGKLANETSRAKSGNTVLKGLDCHSCQEIWCSQECKQMNFEFHGFLKHTGKATKRPIHAEAFDKLAKFCVKKQWSSLFAISLIFAESLFDREQVKWAQFCSMARVSQRVRFETSHSSAGAFDVEQGGVLYDESEQELLWKEGYELFSDVFQSAMHDVDLEEFLCILGTYSLNHLDSSIFLLQSHLNHDCEPNLVVKGFTKKHEGIEVYAARDIKKGETLSIAYVNPTFVVQRRKREVRVNWGFNCLCKKCASDLSSQQRRKSSISSIKNRDDVRQMLRSSAESSGVEIDLAPPLDYNGERRKSVRFE